MIFWLFVKVVITIAPSGSIPNHIGIGCGTPSAPMLQRIMVFEAARKASASSGVMRICARRDIASSEPAMA